MSTKTTADEPELHRGQRVYVDVGHGLERARVRDVGDSLVSVRTACGSYAVNHSDITATEWGELDAE